MRTRTVLLGGQAAALGLMTAFLVVPGSALFLHVYGARTLPWAYLMVAAAGVLTSAAVSRAGRRVSLSRLAVGLITVFMAIVAACWLALVLAGADWATFVLVVLFPLAIPVGFIAVGSQAVRLFDVRELKAQFPRVVAGFPLGFAVGGFAAALLAGLIGGVEQLLLVDLLCALGMLALVVRTAREFPGELKAPPPRVAVPLEPATRSRWSVLRDPLVAAVLGYQVLSGAVTQLLDFIVWERAAANYPDPESLARFQGVFGASMNVVSILFVALAASWLLRRYGVRLGLAANPALVLVATVVMLALGQSAGIVGLGFLLVACTAQVADIATTDGLTRTSVAATYQAVPPDRRLPAQALVEGSGTPVSIGLAGAGLLLIKVVNLDVLAVGWLVLGLSVLWLALALVTYRAYGGHLAEVLHHRSWDAQSLRIDGPAAEEAVRRLLEDDDPRARVTGLEALADSGSPALEAELARALADEHPRVRMAAFDLVGREGLARRPRVSTALVGLLDTTPDGARAAALLSGDPGQADPRALAVWVGAATGSDEESAEAAVVGAATSPDPARLPHLLELAGRPQPPLGILEALGAHADLLGPALTSSWTLPPGSPAEDGRRRVLVLHAVAASGRTPVRDRLLARLAAPELSRDDLRLVVEGLAPTSWTRQPATVRASLLAAPLEAEIARAYSCLLGLHHVRLALELPDEEARSALSQGAAGSPQSGEELGVAVALDALRDELREAQRHIELLFGATACPRGTAWFLRALRGEDSQLRATAMELAEATLGRRRGSLVIAALDPTLDDDERLRALATSVPALPPAISVDAAATWLGHVATDPDGRWASPWLSASVLRCLPRLSPDLARRCAQERFGDVDPVVAETAAWVLSGDRPAAPEAHTVP